MARDSSGIDCLRPYGTGSSGEGSRLDWSRVRFVENVFFEFNSVYRLRVPWSRGCADAAYDRSLSGEFLSAAGESVYEFWPGSRQAGD